MADNWKIFFQHTLTDNKIAISWNMMTILTCVQYWSQLLAPKGVMLYKYTYSFCLFRTVCDWWAFERLDYHFGVLLRKLGATLRRWQQWSNEYSFPHRSGSGWPFNTDFCQYWRIVRETVTDCTAFSVQIKENVVPNVQHGSFNRHPLTLCISSGIVRPCGGSNAAVSCSIMSTDSAFMQLI